MRVGMVAKLAPGSPFEISMFLVPTTKKNPHKNIKIWGIDWGILDGDR
jgi:hypothetical protein